MADPDIALCEFLLHCNGASGSTTFTDISPSPKTVNANGLAEISTAFNKFGGASLSLYNYGDYLEISSWSDVDITGNFTLELWAYWPSMPNSGICLFYWGDSTGDYELWCDAGATLNLKYNKDNSTTITGSTDITRGSWHHVALVKNGTTLTAYLDGVSQGSTTHNWTMDIASSMSNMSVGFDILMGVHSPTNDTYIDEIVGWRTARYTANFTPPTAEIAGPDAGINITPTQLALILAFQTPEVKISGQHITPEQIALTKTFQTPALKVGNKITPSIIALGLIFQNPEIINRTLAAIANLWMTTHYRCTLTGAPDSTTDLILPISSFQTRHDIDPRRSYLSVIVPGIDNYIDAINARPNGRLKIDRIYTYLAGDTDEFEMSNTIYDSITINQGGRSGSTGQISGFENLPYLSAETITLSSPVYRAMENGRRRYRCAIDPRVRPGDTVTINSETFVTSTVLFIIDSKTAIMEVQELL